MKKGFWKDEEVKQLFNQVEKAKKNNLPLKEAFSQHAKKYNRKANSVRNYYYHEVDSLFADSIRRKKLGIEMKNHEKANINYFSEQEESTVMQKIDNMVKQGNSVRKACLILSNNNIDLMLRYQNKYRNFISKSNVAAKSNVITFTNKKELLSDNDITSLFLGLVRLVKKNAMDEVANNSNFAELLRNATLEIGQKDNEIRLLKENLLKAKSQMKEMEKEIVKLRCEKAVKLRKKLSAKDKELLEG